MLEWLEWLHRSCARKNSFWFEHFFCWKNRKILVNPGVRLVFGLCAIISKPVICYLESGGYYRRYRRAGGGPNTFKSSQSTFYFTQNRIKGLDQNVRRSHLEGIWLRVHRIFREYESQSRRKILPLRTNSGDGDCTARGAQRQNISKLWHSNCQN